MGKYLWYHCREQKKNNKGASLVMVLIVMALVMILVTVVMSMTLVNYRMKYTNLRAQENFYTAESALAEIRVGLAGDSSDVSASAYTSAMENFSLLDEKGRTLKFQQEYEKGMKAKLLFNSTDNTYSVDYLTGFLKETAFDDAYGIGAKITTPAGTNALNVTSEGIVLKNVTVTYHDEKGYMTQIKTDIALNYPKLDFSQSAKMPPLASYALVAADYLAIDGNKTCELYGNAYLGKQANKMSEGARLVAGKNPASYDKELLISGSTLKGENNAVIEIRDMEVWADNFVVDSSRAAVTDSALYLKNDLVLANSRSISANAKISGEYYGYGNIDSAVKARAALENPAGTEDIKQNPANYSSSIIVNGTGNKGAATTLDLSGLKTFKISGNSYINGKAQKGAAGSEADEYAEINTADVLMGESISTRTSQIAYLVPADCIAPGMVNGGTNPMPVSQYSGLLKELETEYGEDGEKRLVDLDMKSSKLKDSLRNFGVNDWQIEAHQLVTVKSLVYIFVKFDSQEAANRYFDRYYNTVGGTKLEDLLDQTYVGIQMPKDTAAFPNTSFYLNGNVLAGEASKIYLPSRREKLSAEEKQALHSEEVSYQDSYEALNHKLVKSYDQLADSEKHKSPYQNLVNSMISASDVNYTIASGGKKSFVKSTGEAAVIVNGDYDINAANTELLKQVPDAKGNKHADAELHVVIASGDVTVSKDFDGLIFAGGKITITDNVKITSDNEAVSLALMAGNADGIHAYDYLVNGKNYCISGSNADRGDNTGKEKEDRGYLDMMDYVTYENWTKQ